MTYVIIAGLALVALAVWYFLAEDDWDQPHPEDEEALDRNLRRYYLRLANRQLADERGPGANIRLADIYDRADLLAMERDLSGDR